MRGHQHERLTRRRFLQTGAAATLGLGGLPALLRADEAKAGPYGGFKMGVQSYSFRNFSTEEAVKKTQDLGLHYIEFFRQHIDPASSPQQTRAVVRLCRDHGITPLGFGVEHYTKDYDHDKKLFDFGKALGVKYLSASPDPDSFDTLDKLVEEYQIAIAIHPHGPVGGGRMDRWYSAEIIWKAVKDHNPLIGSCLDVGHLIRAAILGKKLDPAHEIRVMDHRNYAIHLKDNDNKTDTNVILGKGALNVAAVLKALKDVGFTGGLMLEYEAHPEDPMPDMRACLEVVRDTIKGLG